MQLERASKVGVLRAGTEFGVQALQPIAQGETILMVEGIPTGRPSRHSLQVAAGVHLEVPEDFPIEEEMDSFPWRFLNHSCHPNAAFDGRCFVACRPIAAGEQVTFDYDTTELEIAATFDCRCGSAGCRGRRIRGFKHLSDADRDRLAPFLAPHLRALLG